jgi:Ca2+/H+ antiporter
MNTAIIILSAHLLALGIALLIGRFWYSKQKNKPLARYYLMTALLFLTGAIFASEVAYRFYTSEHYRYSAGAFSPLIITLILQQSALRKLKTRNENGA